MTHPVVDRLAAATAEKSPAWRTVIAAAAVPLLIGFALISKPSQHRHEHLRKVER